MNVPQRVFSCWENNLNWMLRLPPPTHRASCIAFSVLYSVEYSTRVLAVTSVGRVVLPHIALWITLYHPEAWYWSLYCTYSKKTGVRSPCQVFFLTFRFHALISYPFKCLVLSLSSFPFVSPPLFVLLLLSLLFLSPNEKMCLFCLMSYTFLCCIRSLSPFLFNIFHLFINFIYVESYFPLVVDKSNSWLTSAKSYVTVFFFVVLKII